jgi:hypothetical protein
MKEKSSLPKRFFAMAAVLLLTQPMQAQEPVAARVLATNPIATITSVTMSACAGNSLKLYYSVSRPFDPGNQFTVELSDAAGSFAAPSLLRTFTATNGGVVSAPIPVATPAGTLYRVRLMSSAPADLSADNGGDITINTAPTINPMPNRIFCPNTNTGAVNFTGTANSYTWVNSNTNIGLGASGSGAVNNFIIRNNTTALDYGYIKVTPVSNAGCVGKAMGFRMMIYPLAKADQIAPVIACRGVVVPPLTITGNMPGNTYNWASSSTSTGMVQVIGVNVIPGFVTVNANPVGSVSTELTITPKGPGGCNGAVSASFIQINNCGTRPGDTGGDPSNARLANPLSVGPNPARSTVQLRFAGLPTLLIVEIRDAFGRSLSSPRSFTGNSTTLDISGLRPGIYYVQVTDPATGRVSQQQLIKL